MKTSYIKSGSKQLAREKIKVPEEQAFIAGSFSGLPVS
ncbi:hypothetical protein AJ81_07130 [Pseudothermotoga hypogea DSM 11164 = NBRC 106472]|uniref:Uncharacterized protein n=1 Tax=Pseudothermotoga hypogea DSM 11164 = NBRC 106472 TaxID=1123384 RepID=A0A0X1KU66_9THEM|nr:hypothetical protein AJ81_07130 [Pseudothermotoga hypogea DSM 11164 = NBRC 106472]